MAALKKPMRRKEQAKPSTVLIIFLVFFILLSIGLGVAAYYGYEGQNKLKEAAANDKKSLNAQKGVDDYRAGVIVMLAGALGQELPPEIDQRGRDALGDLLKEQSKYNEPDRKIWMDLNKELDKDLTFDAASQKFKENLRAKYAATKKSLEDTSSQLAQAKADLTAEKSKYAEQEKKNEANAKARADQIGKAGAAAQAESAKKFASFDELVKINQEIQSEKIEAENKLEKAKEELSIEKTRYQKFLESLDKKAPGQEIALQKKNGEQHAVMLDLSRGMPLWDRPLGKVTRVELERRQVYINIGSALGVRPELTFNVFADDGKGNADKFLKATIEVIRVIDGQSSLCRITSIYDAAGLEINMNDPTVGRTAREVEAALREGDLIFNMFWNAHVAVAGIINFTGSPIEAPAEQMRQIETFTQLLARKSIHTDALLDLNDGQMKGTISNKTRFLILGDSAYPKNPNDDAQKERAKVINDGIAAMKKTAMENGLFLISAENFTIAAGYRTARNANATELGKFRGTVPLAGPAGSGLVIQRDTPAGVAPAPPMPKKEEEKKLPEGKEKEKEEKK